jgi:hypothetical protein
MACRDVYRHKPARRLGRTAITAAGEAAPSVRCAHQCCATATRPVCSPHHITHPITYPFASRAAVCVALKACRATGPVAAPIQVASCMQRSISDGRLLRAAPAECQERRGGLTLLPSYFRPLFAAALVRRFVVEVRRTSVVMARRSGGSSSAAVPESLQRVRRRCHDASYVSEASCHIAVHSACFMLRERSI